MSTNNLIFPFYYLKIYAIVYLFDETSFYFWKYFSKNPRLYSQKNLGNVGRNHYFSKTLSLIEQKSFKSTTSVIHFQCIFSTQTQSMVVTVIIVPPPSPTLVAILPRAVPRAFVIIFPHPSYFRAESALTQREVLGSEIIGDDLWLEIFLFLFFFSHHSVTS